ncbi:MAG: hypothetical protein HY343_11470 [Lentisphaerae bacterium]|nr:hypothetical protein [Lentisphaerota bacterium]
MTPAPAVFLKAQQLHRVLRGHAWIYRGEIERVEGALVDGAVADVFTQAGRFVGRGYANTRSEITIRLLTRAREAIDEAFWKQRLEQAVQYRRRRYPGRAALRWVNGEADALPGLIVDQYDRTIVLQTNTLAMDRQKTLFTRLLVELFSPEAVLENNKEIHVRALTLLNPGGLLATFCCSHHVSAPLFLETILDAAADVNARLRREELFTAAPDHPVLPAIPETEYLKGYLFTLLP